MFGGRGAIVVRFEMSYGLLSNLNIALESSSKPGKGGRPPRDPNSKVKWKITSETSQEQEEDILADQVRKSLRYSSLVSFFYIKKKSFYAL